MLITIIRRQFKKWERAGRLRLLVRGGWFAYRNLRDLKALPMAPLVCRQLRVAADGRDIEVNLELAFVGMGGVIRPRQVRGEIRCLLERLQRDPPRRALEIGTARGGTLFLLCRVCARDATIISVDMPGGWFGGGYSLWKKLLYRQFAGSNQRLRLLRCDSHSQRTLERVKKELGGEKLDFAMIDGDHTYEGVKRDFEMYAPLVREGGLIAFHDIVPNRHDTACEVPRFWKEIRANWCFEEYVADPRQSSYGIGVLKKRALVE